MVDPRIYRAGLAVVAIAVIVFGFSLMDEPGGMSTTLAPGQYFASAPGTLKTLAGNPVYRDRTPGSPGDSALAAYVSEQLTELHDGQSPTPAFSVSTSYQEARTADGSRTLATVTASRTGLDSGVVVVVSDRDATGAAAEASLSSTVVMLDLARALAGATLNRSVMLVSTSGSVGAAGATQLAASLTSQPVDAVIVLGDLAGAHATRPVIVPWSGTAVVAPPVLRNTVAGFVQTQTGLATGHNDLGGQLAHLAFPFTITDQAPFGADGIPAVLVSLSGERLPAASEPVDPSRMIGLGNALLESVNALDAGPAVPAPGGYLLISGKIVPLWAVRLLVLALMLPVIMATVDALARTRRRGHSIVRWVLWVLAGALPALIAFAVVVLARVTGVLHATPPGAVGSDAIAIGASGTITMVVAALLAVAAFLLLRPLCIRLASRIGASTARRPETPAADAAAVAVTVVACATAVVIWVLNPFAAALLVPALHLWMWLSQPRVRSRRVLGVLLALAAVIPAALVAIYDMHAFGLSPVGWLWSVTLLAAGGGLSVVAAIYWSVALGTLASALLIAIRSTQGAAAPEPAVSVRGPASYAGPGSLGGTESALRR